MVLLISIIQFYAFSCSNCVMQAVFNISSSSLQMKGETGTIGLDAYVTNDRTIWLDCQPLMSAALAERELSAAHSKYSFSFNTFTLENMFSYFREIRTKYIDNSSCYNSEITTKKT